jgi:elongation factor Ts
MAEIPAKLVMELRSRTGAGMMDCKRALQETDGDLEGAVDYLRKRGVASAEKRAERTTNEGVVLTRVDGSVGAIVAIGCETEPVSKMDEFRDFAEQVLDAVGKNGATAKDDFEDDRVALVGKIGENIQVVGGDRLDAQDGDVLGEYVHPPARKKGVLVKLRGGDAATARQLAMHISFAAPRYVSRDQVPAEDVERERSILAESEDVKGKPDEVREKMVGGRLDKWYGEAVLVDQAWIHDASLKVGKALEQAGAEVVDFRHFALG